MATTLNAERVTRTWSVPRVAGLIAMVLGCTVLVGWGLDVRALQTLLLGLNAMMPNTAVGFVLLGVALMPSGHSVARWARSASRCWVWRRSWNETVDKCVERGRQQNT